MYVESMITNENSSSSSSSGNNINVSSSPTIIPIESNPSSSSSIQNSIDNHVESSHISTRKSVPVKRLSMSYFRYRLNTRDFYLGRLGLVSNMMCIIGILGIVLMIIENELTFNRINNKDSKASWSIKLIITFTTAILLLLILYYHQLDISLYSFRNSLEDWRVEVTSKKLLLIAIEILVCAIHPIPRSYPQNLDSNPSELDPYSLSYTAIDVGLGLPMFLRLYLLGRCILVHSPLFRQAPFRSLGYLNHVSINFYFLMKTYLEQWPTRCLLTFCTCACLIGSWSLRACDYKSSREHMSMAEAIWLFIITFTTVGYGDQYPSTYCGRGIAAIIGLLGLILSALLIAILAKKLLLTRDEKYLHTFVLNTKLGKARQNHAANVIKFAIKIWFLKRKNKYPTMEHFQAQRKLFRSIHSHQVIRREQRNLDNQCVGMLELMTVQRSTGTHTKTTMEQMMIFRNEMKEIKDELLKMNQNMYSLQKTLDVLLEKKM